MDSKNPQIKNPEELPPEVLAELARLQQLGAMGPRMNPELPDNQAGIMPMAHPVQELPMMQAGATQAPTDMPTTQAGMADGGPIIEDSNLEGLAKLFKKAAGEGDAPPAEDPDKMKAAMDMVASKPPTKMADGGQITVPTATAPHKAPEGPSDAEKRELVMKSLHGKPRKMDDGGLAVAPAADDWKGKLAAIAASMGDAGSNLFSNISNSPVGRAVAGAAPIAGEIANDISDPVQGAMDIGSKFAAPVVSAEGGAAKSALGLSTAAPVTPDQQSLNDVEGGTGGTPMVPPAAPAPTAAAPTMGGKAPTAPAATDPLSQLGKFDPNSVTPGMNPQDRMALANGLQSQQHSFGNYLAQAVAGLGDAVAAKGGSRQDALGDIYSMQTQQRKEALENFDKARSSAIEHFTMKNQADQNLIANVKARGELQVSPEIAQMLGRPALAGKPVAQADLLIKSDQIKADYANKMQERKQAALNAAANEVENTLKHGGIFGTQKAMDPKAQQKMIFSQAVKSDPEAFGYSVSGGH